MKIEALETLVRIWAEDRGIFEHGTPAAQFIKTREEVNELGQAILDGDEEQIKDGIGDTIVTLIIIAKMQGLTLSECLSHAYDQIAARKGKMVNGVFVKESDL